MVRILRDVVIKYSYLLIGDLDARGEEQEVCAVEEPAIYALRCGGWVARAPRQDQEGCLYDAAEVICNGVKCKTEQLMYCIVRVSYYV